MAHSAASATRWDLAQPLPTQVPIVLRLHPLEAARKIVASGRGIAPFERTIDVPALELGNFAVTVSANLPRHTAQIIEVDVELVAPADPTHGRPGAITQTVRLKPPEYSGNAMLRFSPAETPRYAWRASLVLDDGSELKFGADDARVWTDAASVVIDADAMPARFVLVEPESALGTSAALKCICSWTDGDQPRGQTFDIGVGGSGDDGACFVLPIAATNAIVRIEARPPGGSAAVTYGPLALAGSARIPLGFYSFREFGLQTVTVRALFGEHSPEFVWVDLRPKTAAKTERTLTLDKAHDAETWSWTADSIFASGYLYRIRTEDQAADPGPPWSAIQSPFTDLTLDLRVVADPHSTSTR